MYRHLYGLGGARPIDSVMEKMSDSSANVRGFDSRAALQDEVIIAFNCRECPLYLCVSVTFFNLKDQNTVPL